MTRKKSILLFLLLSLYLTSQGQTHSYIQYDAKDGLPSNNVYMSFQDSKGFIWFGTDAGLSRFDGRSFENFNTEDGLPDNDIFDMLEDRQGRIWFATYNGRLGYYKEDRFYSATNDLMLKGHHLKSYITCMYEDSKGNVWFGSRYDGIKYLDTSGKFHTAPVTKSKGKFHRSTFTFAIWENSDGDVYALTSGYLENLTKKESISLEDVGIVIGKEDVRHCKVQPLNGGKLLLTENSKFYILDKSYNKVIKKTSYNSLSTTVIFLKNGVSENVWAGTYDGLFMINLEEEQDALSIEFLDGLTVSSRKEDNQGNIWFTTLEKGVYYLPSNPVINYTLGDGLPEKKVGTIDGNDLGDIIIGQQTYYSFIKGGSISSFDKDPLYETKHLKKRRPHIYDVSLNNNGDHMVVTTSGIISNINDQNSYYQSNVKAAVRYKNDSIATVGRYGFIKEKIATADIPGKITKDFLEKIPLKDSLITTIYWDDQDSTFWIGLINGLVQIKGNKILNHSSKHPSLNSHVLNIIKSNKRNGIWVSTSDKGVLLLDKNAKPNLHITVDDGLSSNLCKALMEDEDGSLWIATNNGLNRVIDNESKNIIKYGISDGLLSDNINDLYINNDKVWIATNQGLSMMDVSEEKKYSIPVYLMNTSVNGRYKYFNENENTLSYNENNISIDFVALDYNTGGEVLYRYKIKQQQDWRYTTNNSIEFSSLENGTYSFMIQARNKQGIWNEEVSVLNFIIAKPWWKTWWAFSLYIMSVSSLVLGVFKYESRKRRIKFELLLEKKESLRFKELNEFKSQFFTNISHEIRTPLTLINYQISELEQSSNNDDASVQQAKNNIKKQSDIITEMVDSVLDLAKMQSSNFSLQLRLVNISELLRKLYSKFKPLFDQKGIAFTISENMEDYIANVDVIFFERAINNVIVNALKYTDTGSVNIIISQQKKLLHIAFSDTGIGINSVESEAIFHQFYQVNNDINKTSGSGVGLAFSKEIIELHNGVFLLESEVDRGSTFTIVIPIEKTQSTNESSANVTLATDKKNQGYSNLESKIFKFLIVEDNCDMRNYLVSILAGHESVEASNGDVALEILKEEDVDFIITDYLMPKMNGEEFVTKLKSNNDTTPIIMLTAKTDADTKLQVLRLGIDDYITKPFDKDELLARINNSIGNNHARLAYNKKTKTEDPNDDFIEKIKDYIYKKSHETKLNQEVISENFNISKSSFYRRIKSNTGLSPNNFIKEIRLLKAQEILDKNPTILLKQLASEVGFSHHAYFSQIYTKRFGNKPCKKINLKKYK